MAKCKDTCLRRRTTVETMCTSSLQGPINKETVPQSDTASSIMNS